VAAVDNITVTKRDCDCSIRYKLSTVFIKLLCSSQSQVFTTIIGYSFYSLVSVNFDFKVEVQSITESYFISDIL